MVQRHKKILVTGGAGFIGSEFVRQAISQGRSLVVVDKLSYAGDLERLKGFSRKITFYKSDIVQNCLIRNIFRTEKPSTVVHFAAESHVDRSILSDTAFVRTNINGTQSVLSASRLAGVEKFVHISTDEVYGAIRKGKFKEEDPLQPTSPYSASKASADLLVKAYTHTFKFPTSIVRPSNNYGPWQYPEKFIPVVIYKALQDERIPVYAQGLNVREWLHVSDCAAAILSVVDKGKIGEVYNVGSGEEVQNIEVVHHILQILHKPLDLVEFVQDRPAHDWRYALENRKIIQQLGWKPVIRFRHGLEETVNWYRLHGKWLMRKTRDLQAYWKKVYRL